MDTVRIRARINGRVQGVFFRRSTKKQAERLGLSGFIRNEPDGSVILEAEGTRDAVASLFAWAHNGPPLAQVDKIVKEEISTLQEGKFRIF